MLRFVLTAGFVILCACRTAPTSPDTERQAQMLVFVEYLDTLFAERYAPAEFKAQRYGWDRHRQIERLQARLRADPSLSDEDFRLLIRSFFTSMRDIHTAVHFDEVEAVWLGLHLRQVGDEFVIAWIDRTVLPETHFPFAVGDIVSSFAGEDPANLLAKVTEATGYRSTAAFEKSFAEWFLVVRATSEWPIIPAAGSTVDLVVQPAGGAPAAHHTLTWLDMETQGPSARCPFWGRTSQGFLPEFAPAVWRGGKVFPAYVFEDRGERVGSIRVPSYKYGGEQAVEALRDFDATIDKFVELKVSKLIIDQTGNDGGNFLFGFALMSRLIQQPVHPPLQHYLLKPGGDVVGFGTKEALTAMLADVDAVQSDADAATYMAASPIFSGPLSFAPKTQATTQHFGRFLRFFVDRVVPPASLLTDLHFAVQDRIDPRATAAGSRFVGPIVVLIDAINISAAEYVAATYKDTGRATLVGVGTAGAGGDQRVIDRDRVCTPQADDPFAPCVPAAIAAAMHRFGIRSFSYTISLGYRVDAEARVIGPFENTGVEPDVALELTRDDLKNGFTSYRDAVLGVLRMR